MEILIKSEKQNDTFIAITYNDDLLYYIKQYCSHNEIMFVDNPIEDIKMDGIYCYYYINKYLVCNVKRITETENQTVILYVLKFIRRDERSPFHKI
jgi:hypothetical protein